MKDSTRTQAASAIVQDYLALGNTLRLAALPNWVGSELSLSQLKAIVLLEYYGAMMVSELARRLGVGKPAASTVVQQLVQAGLAQRSEDERDRRRTLVRLTPRAAGLITGRREYIQTHLRRWLGRLSDAELAGLQQGLAGLVRVMGEEA